MTYFLFSYNTVALFITMVFWEWRRGQFYKIGRVDRNRILHIVTQQKISFCRLWKQRISGGKILFRPYRKAEEKQKAISFFAFENTG